MAARAPCVRGGTTAPRLLGSEDHAAQRVEQAVTGPTTAPVVKALTGVGQEDRQFSGGSHRSRAARTRSWRWGTESSLCTVATPLGSSINGPGR